MLGARVVTVASDAEADIAVRLAPGSGPVESWRVEIGDRVTITSADELGVVYGPHLVQGAIPAKLAGEYGQVLAKGDTAYSIVNVCNIREHRARLADAVTALRAMRAERERFQTGRWKNWYRGDKKENGPALLARAEKLLAGASESVFGNLACSREPARGTADSDARHEAASRLAATKPPTIVSPNSL
jgi:hypothetical protein